MFDWISKNPDAVILLVTAIGGWLGISKKKADLGKLKELLLAKLRGELFSLIEEHASLDQARKHLEWAADALLSELGIKRSKAVDALLEPLIQQALKEYAERLGPKVLHARLEELLATIGKLPKAFEVEEPTVPKLDLDIEIVPPEGSVAPAGETTIIYGQDYTTESARERAAKAAEIVRAKLAEEKK